MRLSEFDYLLPEERIAQAPVEPRDASRLLVMGGGEALDDRWFRDLPDLLREGDLLVFNDTRVIPARLLGRKATGGRCEILLLERTGEDTWEALLARPPRVGGTVDLGGGFHATLLDRSGKTGTVRLDRGALEAVGRVPLPPYIRREPRPEDRERYQTIYAERPGAVAAPTAGLHFTERVLADLAARGVRTARVTLHVGAGTFLPVEGDEVEAHRMHAEAFDLPDRTARAIEETRSQGGRVIAVGTTVVRTLETRAREDRTVEPGAGRCDLYIYPGFRFRAIDLLLTNFHLPRSTLLLLVCAFGGRDRVLRAYDHAVRAGYRFYSYGDAMLVVP